LLVAVVVDLLAVAEVAQVGLELAQVFLFLAHTLLL